MRRSKFNYIGAEGRYSLESLITNFQCELQHMSCEKKIHFIDEKCWHITYQCVLNLQCQIEVVSFVIKSNRKLTIGVNFEVNGMK